MSKTIPLRRQGVRWLSSLAACGLLLCLVLAATTRAQSWPTLESEEQAFLDLINGYRQENGLEPFLVSAALTNSSKWMSADMAQKNYFSHTDSLGRNPFVRMADFSYNYNTWMGENIAAGFELAAYTFLQFKNSPSHNHSMLNPDYRVIGIGRAYGGNSAYEWYWTIDFGGYVDQTITSNQTAPTLTLSYAGKLRDRVGQGPSALDGDGMLDGVFTVTLQPGNGSRTVTALELNSNSGGYWATASARPFWIIGAAGALDEQLNNLPNGAVSFTLAEGGSFFIFASDYNDILFRPGTRFTLTVHFSAGSAATASTVAIN